MQLSDVLELVVREGVRRHVEKRAGIMLPLAVGMMVPGIVHKAMERSRSTEQALDHANHPLKTAATPPSGGMEPYNPLYALFSRARSGAAGVGQSGPAKSFGSGVMGGLGAIGGAPAGGVASGLSKLVERKMFGREFGEKRDALSIGGQQAVGAFGKEMGTTGARLLVDIANKAMEAAGHAGDASARTAIIGDLKKTDSVLASADDATLMEAYHTMTRFAPVLSTDKNAVRSFLRQAVMSGSGPDYMSIKLLADSERAVTGGGDKRAALDLSELLAAAARPALAGAGAGAITGAISDKDDRSGGALRGALTGGAMGGLGGALHGHLTGVPKDQGGLQPHLEDFGIAKAQGRSPSVIGVPSEDRKQMWNPRANPTPGYPHQGLRDLPIGAAEVAQELGHSPFGGKPVRS